MARTSLRDLKRRRPAKRPRLRILVVSEGSKTEGLYLSLFVRDLRAANVGIEILGRECGSDPLTVVEFAKARFKSDPGYDVCYCLVDRDNHPVARFNASLALAAALNAKYNNRNFHVIVSDPCIEFWFLLHFSYTRSPFVSEGNKSRADRALDELKKHLPDYGKSARDPLIKIIPLTSQAIANSINAAADAEATGDPNPSTSMHIMVERVLRESGKIDR